MLKAALYGDGDELEDDYVRGIWDIDNIPKGKRTALKKFYNNLLAKMSCCVLQKVKTGIF